MFFDLGTYSPIAALLLIAVIFAVFVSERHPAHVVAFVGAAAALALGLVATDDVLRAISNPAPATIAAMFVLSAALVRTGSLELLVDVLKKLAARSAILTILFFFGTAAVASAFLNNTPVVMVLIPVAIGLGRQIGISSSRLLIPLSYMVILGGAITLVGTSTNLLVDGITQDLGLAPFSLFEIAPLGIIVAIIGGGFLALVARWLLPDRETVTTLTAGRETKSWLADLFIPNDSLLIGQAPLEISAFTRDHGRVVDVVRGDASLRRDLKSVRLQAGDIVVLKTRDVDLVEFREGGLAGARLADIEPAQLRASKLVEVLVAPQAKAIGRRMSHLRWRRRFGVYPLALHRKGEQIGSRFESTALTVGDTILIEGGEEDIARLIEDQGLIGLQPNEARAFRRSKAPLAIAILLGVVIMSGLNIAPILPLALIGAALVIATGCIEADEGLAAMDSRLLLLIVSMLVLGSALESSGAVEEIIAALSPLLAGVSPWLALVIVYAITSITTELVTNNAVAVLMTPIAAGLAVSLGVDPRPFIVAVMFAASASFATPIGYQTNTLVYNAGGYRFADFLRIGVPMNLVIGLITALVIPVFWPL